MSRFRKKVTYQRVDFTKKLLLMGVTQQKKHPLKRKNKVDKMFLVHKKFFFTHWLKKKCKKYFFY